MAVFQQITGKLVSIDATTFSAAGLEARADIERLLKQEIVTLSPDTLFARTERGS